jgi:hypothetical protein
MRRQAQGRLDVYRHRCGIGQAFIAGYGWQTALLLLASTLALILVLAIPLYDGVYVTIWRVRRGRSPFVGGHEHISHRLVQLGLSKRRAVVVLWLLTAVTAMSGIGLFATLYKYSDPKNVIVLDDCDIWQDQDALNILKGALDSGKTRRISWNKDSRILSDEGIPNTYISMSISLDPVLELS